ncbi:MAG: dihydrolipoyl dehydrogenase [Candidatus Hadarchaeota archaeon]
MEEYDLIVVGTGSGMNIASRAVSEGLKVAVIDKDPLGGTCLNRGCIPSKVMIYPADVITEAHHAGELGVDFGDPEIDFQRIIERTRKIYLADREQMKKAVDSDENLTFYNEKAKFVNDYTLDISGEKIRSDRILLFSGSRPLIPPIEGIEDVGYYTNRNIFEINEKPESMIIIGGGYIACELAHFFSAVGTDVKIIEQMPSILPTHDPDISKLLERKLSSRMEVLTGHRVVEVGEDEEGKFALTEGADSGDTSEVGAESILVAAGRRSNADLLEVEKTGVETDEDGWIVTNEFLETTKPGIWAGGDATGKYMFKHVANYEAAIVWHNAFTDHNMKPSYHAVPSAVYTRPQIASVGLSVEEAKKNHDILVGRSEYKDTAKGYAMGNRDGFCKIIIDKENGEILGANIVGPYAPILIQEVINLMYTEDRSVNPLFDAMHIHPALTEVVSWALDDLREP